MTSEIDNYDDYEDVSKENSKFEKKLEYESEEEETEWKSELPDEGVETRETAEEF